MSKNNLKKFFNFTTIRPIEILFFLFVIVVSVGLLATPYYLFAIVPGLAILFLLFLGHNPQFGYYLIVFLIPFDAYRGLSGPYQFLTISKFVGFWIAIVILFYFLLNKMDSVNIKSNMWSLFLIFFVIRFLSALMSEYFFTSLDNLRQLFIAYIFFFITLIFISRNGFCKTLPTILISSISVTSFLSIIGYMFNISLFTMGTWDVSTETLKRATGTTSDPNLFSAMIIFNLPLLAHWFFSSRRFFGKFIAIGLFVINLIAIMLTYSRGGAIVLAVVLLLILIEHIRKFKVKHLGFVTALLLIAIIMIIFFVPSSYWERQKSITETKTDTAMGRRISYLYFGWEAFKEHPIIGSGPGTFSKIYATSIYARHFAIGEEDYYRDAHNSYLEVVVETGAISFVIFLIIIWFSLKNFNNAKILFLSHGEKEMAALVGVYRTSFLSMLIYFFMLSTTYNKYFWFSLALSQIALRLAQKIPGGEYNENATYSK